MKESITRFDLEAAFKALDDLDTPIAEKGIKANRPALNEIFSRKSKFDALFEEYYDISSTEELSDAQEAREAEIAKAKLARIEKIVDLDAESPEDLLTTYVGKYIIQCPQCMTLFYKDKEDIEESEDDASTVNVNEICQHCGNESGYTLIGKVGVADDESADMSDFASESDGELDIDVNEESAKAETGDESAEEATEETESDDFDLDSELDELDLDIEDDEEKQEESLFNKQEGNYLLEQLTEETDGDELDISDDEFAELLTAPEFKKPVSDKAARAMLDNLDEAKKKDLDEEPEGLDEGIFDKIKLAVKDKIAKHKDEKTLKSREEKADWVLANAKIDYNKVKVDDAGECIPDESNQRFGTFLVVGYTNRYTNGKVITMAPTFTNKDLVPGMDKPEEKKAYRDADHIAKGWSMQQGNGPAFIFLAKDKDDKKPVFLCEYFDGEIDKSQDQLEKYFETVKKTLDGAKLRAEGGDTSNNTKMPAHKVEPGMTIVVDNSKEPPITAVVSEVTKSTLSSGAIDMKVKLDNGDEKVFSGVAPETVITLVRTKTESLSTFMMGIEELQEDILEKLIASSLIEAYQNVAGFRLNCCTYLNEQLSVDGTIFFTSGATRKTTYTFNEAYTNDADKICIQGLNEKLGLDKQFTITGNTDEDTKTFIAESFNYLKK